MSAGTVQIVDACALLAYFRNEPGDDLVTNLFTQAASNAIELLMHKVTLTEVIYDMLRSEKAKTSADLINDVRILPITLMETLSDEFIGYAA